MTEANGQTSLKTFEVLIMARRMITSTLAQLQMVLDLRRFEVKVAQVHKISSGNNYDTSKKPLRLDIRS
jgi:hypothetical protein